MVDPEATLSCDASRRRLLLALASTLLPSVSCGRRPYRLNVSALCRDSPVFSNAAAPLTIDAHAHVFNGSDLQIKEFVSQAVVGHEEAELYQLSRALGGILQAVAWSKAPSAREELRVLDGYQARNQTCGSAAQVRQVAATAFQDGYSRGRSELQAAKGAIARTADGASVLGPRPNQPGLGLGAAIDALPPAFDEFEQQVTEPATVLGSQPHLRGYLQFVLHGFNHRHVNAIDYLTTYSKDSPRKIDLVVSSLVDYDWWIAGGRAPRTPLGEQVDVMARISALTGGRVHGFVPFCPFREAMTVQNGGVGTSLALVKRAIETQGFIGVKLYPPMGFAPWGNSDLDVWRDKRSLPPAAREAGFGKRLDAAMLSLFRWCEANDVPIMAHANNSNGPYEDFKQLAGSTYWQRALNAFPGLRVSFGHFGDTDLEDHEGERSRSFVSLMTEAPGSAGANVFADSSYFAGVLSRPAAVVEVLGTLLQESRGVVRTRLMYGTDWTLLLPQRNVERYLVEFIGVIARLEASQTVASGTLANAFFGDNAARFLGLHRGSPARQRLAAFYGRHDVAEPEWVGKVDRLTGA